MERRNLSQGLIIGLILLVGITIFFLHDTSKKNSIIKQLNNEYPSLSIKQELHGVITDIYQGDLTEFRNDARHAFLTVNHNIKIRIKAYELLTDTLLDDVLNERDMIFKKANSDTLLIIKINNCDTVKYRFILTDDLGYPMKVKED